MVQASPSLCARLRFSTKQVGRGFYRGNRVGSMGSHTRYGGYLIDWRKSRAYNMPDLTNFKLTPYVSREINAREYDPDLENENNSQTSQSSSSSSNMAKVGRTKGGEADKLQQDLVKYLTSWRRSNPGEFEQFTRYQHDLRLTEERTSIQGAPKPGANV